MTREPPALEVLGLAKSYGAVRALAGVDLSIEARRVVGLLGPNGAGKTTLLSIVAGLRRPDAGTVRVNGVDARARPREARANIGLAPQEIGLYPTATVEENLEVFGALAGLRGEPLRRRIRQVVDERGLAPLARRRAATLSGGERRRLHLAIAVLHRPSLLLLDEPAAGLDPRSRIAFLELERSLAEDGTAIVHSTNRADEVEAIGHAVAILHEGRVVSEGAVAEVAARHGPSAVECDSTARPLA